MAQGQAAPCFIKMKEEEGEERPWEGGRRKEQSEGRGRWGRGEERGDGEEEQYRQPVPKVHHEPGVLKTLHLWFDPRQDHRRQTTWFLALLKSTNFPCTMRAGECTVSTDAFHQELQRLCVCCSATSWIPGFWIHFTTSPLRTFVHASFSILDCACPLSEENTSYIPIRPQLKHPSSKKPTTSRASSAPCPQHTLLQHSLCSRPSSFAVIKYLFRLSFITNGAKNVGG